MSGLDDLFAKAGPTMSVTQVADLLGMSKQGIYGWLTEGVIPGYKVGQTWFIVRDELKATLRKGANPAAVADDVAEPDER